MDDKLESIISVLVTRIEDLEREVCELKSDRVERLKKASYELPDCIDSDLFKDFLATRKKLKAVNSDRAIKSLITKLSGFYNDGFDPNAIISESLENSWKGVFKPKLSKSEQKQSSNISVFNNVYKELQGCGLNGQVNEIDRGHV